MKNKNNLKISIITPSFNQGQFIEETIKSVQNQTYRNFEHIVVDGGSTDNTLSILKKYTGKIKWISEKDKGQSDAINKGLKMAKGEILCWLNSDDYFPSYTLEYVVNFFNKNPKAYWVTGDYFIVDEKGKEIQKYVRYYKKFLRVFPIDIILYIANFINQPSTFFRKEVIKEIGFLNEKLNYEMDYEYWLRISKKYKLFYIDKPLSYFRIHKKSKGGSEYKKQFNEELQVARNFCKNEFLNFLHKLHNFLVIISYNLLKS